ncbi:MAG: hypothetical protein RLP44_21415 [Aggregatilineales bacterium]
MPTIFSLSSQKEVIWAASSQGLLRIESNHVENVHQPLEIVLTCLALSDRIIVAGSPHGIVFSKDNGISWTAAWLDGVDALVTCLVAQPENDSVILAGTQEGHVLRSTDYGEHWEQVNVGLHQHPVLCISWMPSRLEWPHWETVFVGTEGGLYRSPNGGRAWKQVMTITDAVQCIGVDVENHIFAGTETIGLWSSADMGHHFEPVDQNFETVNALALPMGVRVLSDTTSLWYRYSVTPHSTPWKLIPDIPPALVLLFQDDKLWIGHEAGLQSLSLSQLRDGLATTIA